MSSALVVHAADAAHFAGTWHNLFIVIWRQPPRADRIAAFEKPILALSEAHPEGIGWVAVMHTDSPMPSSEARAAGGALFKQLGERCHFQVAILKRQSLASSLLRTTMRTLAMVSGKQRVFLGHSAEEAAGWVAGQPTPISTEASFVEGVKRACETYEARVPT